MARALKVSGWVLMTLLAAFITLVSLRYFFHRPEVAAGEPLGEKFAAHLRDLGLNAEHLAQHPSQQKGSTTKKAATEIEQRLFE